MSTEQLTPRQRQRLATMEDIIVSARRRMREDDEFTMRAVASDIGLTGPGLYRYVNSMDELHALIVHASIGEVCGYLSKRVANYLDPVEQLVCITAAMRTWSLHNPTEFRLAFISLKMMPTALSAEQMADLASRLGVGQLNAPHELGAMIVPYFLRAVSISEYTSDVQAELIEDLIEELPGPDAEALYPFLEETSDPVASFTFLQMWSRVFGAICFEVFDHLEQPTVKAAMLFKMVIIDLANRLGAPISRERITQIIQTEIAIDPAA